MQVGFQPLPAPESVCAEHTGPAGSSGTQHGLISQYTQIPSGSFTIQVHVTQGKHLAVKTIRSGEENFV